MGYSTFKTKSAGIDLAEFPTDLLTLVILNLDGPTIFTSFILVCKSFKKVYFDFLDEFHLDLTNESRLQRPKNFLQGVAKFGR